MSRAHAISFLLCVLLPATVTAQRSAAQRTWHPTLSSVNPNMLVHGASITLGGTDLNPPGWQRRLRYPLRYGGNADQALSYTSSATQLVVAAHKDMRGDSIRIEWVVGDTAATSNPIPSNERVRYFTSAVVVQAPPVLTFAGTQVTPDLGPPFKLMAIAGSRQGIIKGKYLRKTSLPTVTRGGTSRPVIAHQYEPRGWLTAVASCCDNGADAVYFTPPTQKTSGWLVIDNILGRDSAAVTFALPPAPSQVVAQTANGTAALVPANTLQRGGTFVVRGQHLSVSHVMGGTTSIKRGAVTLGGTTITPSFASDTNIVFTVPNTFASSSAALSVVTLVGTAALGAFSIVNAPVAIDVVGLTPTPTVITAGRTIQFFASLNVPANAPKDALGNLIVSTPNTPVGALRIKSPIQVTGPSTEVKVEGGNVQATTPVTLLVAHESNGVNGVSTQTRQVTFSVRPPHPVSVRGPGPLTAGSSQQFQVMFDSTTDASSTIFTLLSSSNPNVVAVPASATLSGNSATFTATIPPVSQAGGTATLSATLDGATASLPVTVQLPQPQQVSLFRDRFSDAATTALPHAMVRAEALFNGQLIPTTSVNFSSSDTALALVQSNTPSPDGLSNDGLLFTRYLRVGAGLSQQRQATITATYAGVSKTASVTLIPILVSSFTATPSSGTAGTTVTATALLSNPSIGLMHMAFVSADTTKAAVSPPAASQLTSGSTSKSGTIQLSGPVNSPRQVPITVTLRAGDSLGTIVSTQTLVVTVNP